MDIISACSRFQLGAITALFCGWAEAQVIDPPEVHWVGPESSCKYATIQTALAEIYSCGGAICPPVEHELRLSAGYNHAGQILLNRSVTIVGGYAGQCGNTSAGPRTVLGGAGPGTSLIRVDPGSRSIQVTLTRVQLEGSGESGPAQGNLQGGVIHMAAGDATVTLDRSVVANGVAALGGGVFLSGDGPSLVIDDSFIQDNTAAEGGGIYCVGGGLVDLRRGRVENNLAQLSGGGIQVVDGCRLVGSTPGSTFQSANRAVAGNTVSDLHQGRGAGVFARRASVRLGALYSFTEIRDNVVETFRLTSGPGEVPQFDQHRYDEPGTNQGGGVYLAHTDAVFLNTRLLRNEAADGGAIAVAGDSRLLVDRSTGPCRGADDGDDYDCSVLAFNRARGGREQNSDEAGDGSALLAVPLEGSTPEIKLQRSLVAGNHAGCFEPDESDFEGECDLEIGGVIGNPERVSFSSTIRSSSARLVLAGNLFTDNRLGDSEDCFLTGSFACEKYTSQLDFSSSRVQWLYNTLHDTTVGDGILRARRGDPVEFYNSILWAPSTDNFVFLDAGTYNTPSISSSCLISNFAGELNETSEDIVISAIDVDPVLVDPANGDYRPDLALSPAVDRCDSGGGSVVLPYDIMGNPRPIDVAVSNVHGTRDTGAIELMAEADPVPVTTDLALVLQSDLPRTTPIGVDHRFTLQVFNQGRSTVSAMTVDMLNGAVVSLSGQVVPGGMGLVQHWDCDPFGCTYIGPPLAPGAATPQINGRVRYGSMGIKTIRAFVENTTVTIPGDLEPANNEASDTVTVGDGADLKIAMAGGDEVAPGELAHFEVSVTNQGPESGTGVVVRIDSSHSSLWFDEFGTPGWFCQPLEGPELLCNLNGSLPVFAAASFEFGATDSDAGDRIVGAQVTSSGPADPESGNNQALREFRVLGVRIFAGGFEADD
ncbi:MAG: hypothetical protein QNJ40_05520 [Xanthomonadales bacterium]|nr:hypothetical protein [Xanthomonadales bacterium]